MKKTLRVVGCIIRNNDKILLLYRSASETDPSLWGIPAGKVDKGETDSQTAVRELFEETGIKLSENSLDYLGHLPIEYNTLIVDFLIFTASFDNTPAVELSSREHIDYQWIKPIEVLELTNLMKDVDIIIKSFCIDKLRITD